MQILGDADEAKQFREQENLARNQSEVESDHENENQEVEVRKTLFKFTKKYFFKFNLKTTKKGNFFLLQFISKRSF